ncbi:hypothetical protein SAMN04488591_2606 [Microbacterium azadirachtae]|uniref:Uncharacterized protein n=1 Tax=Microbacterium azadirachtae TaxID=582680 RepID=A0A1I6IG83_9MICO|nr:hypothetical protein SAMN04488591_2606 [Microbacterium azadirachtae]
MKHRNPLLAAGRQGVSAFIRSFSGEEGECAAPDTPGMRPGFAGTPGSA